MSSFLSLVIVQSNNTRSNRNQNNACTIDGEQVDGAVLNRLHLDKAGIKKWTVDRNGLDEEKSHSIEDSGSYMYYQNSY